MRQAHERPRVLLEDVEPMKAALADPERTASSPPAAPIKK
jgi:hypothetical protein